MFDSIVKFFFEGDRSKSLIVLAVGAVGGALLKFFFDQWSAKNHARRDMIASVTKSVEDLARQYYWHLANNASTLAVIFSSYLDRRKEIQLLQSPPRELRRQLDALIEHKVRDSFYYYARLTKLTYQFDWRAGSTFFLRDFWAGQSIRKLQNALKGVLDLDFAIIDYVDALGTDGKPKETTPSDLLNEKALADVRKNYFEFFKDEERVRSAARYLQTCGDLFNYELAELYRDWFKNRWGRVPLEPPLNSRALRTNLTATAIKTIGELVRDSRTAGYAIAPLSSSADLQAAKASAPEAPTPETPAAEPQEPERDQSGRGAAPVTKHEVRVDRKPESSGPAVLDRTENAQPYLQSQENS